MDHGLTFSILREALWLVIKLSSPILIVSLIVGLVISLFQALTQIQEQTLTFVPKMLTVFLLLILMMPYLLESLESFAQNIFQLMVIKEGARNAL